MSQSPPMFELRLLGSTELRRADGTDASALLAQPRMVALLAYLAAAGAKGAYHRRDRVVGLFWPDSGQDQARANLRKLVHVVRKELGDEAIESRGDEELRLSPLGWCDVWELEEAAARGRLARADELYRGELLLGFFPGGAPEFERWLSDRRTELAEQAADVALTLARKLAGEANLTGATKWARRAARLAVYDERKFRRALELVASANDAAGALRLYEEFERRLAEIDARPSAETRELADRIRRGEGGRSG